MNSKETKNKLPLYAVTDGRGGIRSLHIGRDCAVKELNRMVEGGESAGIIQIRSLQDFINEYANFENPADDEWMEEVITYTTQMIFEIPRQPGGKGGGQK